MKWWVIRNGRVIGWVIAADEADAHAHADAKFPPTWQSSNEVSRRRRKRGRV